MTVQVDETSDVSTKEQVSIIVHLEKGNEIVERQLAFVDVSTDRNVAVVSQVITPESRRNLFCKPMRVLLFCLAT